MKKDLFLLLILNLQIDLFINSKDLGFAKDVASDILVTIDELDSKNQRELKPIRDVLENFLGVPHFEICLN